MPDSEEEIYSIMFSSLKHPARRKILRMLADSSMSFSEMLEALGVSSSHLTYHLENLGGLLLVRCRLLRKLLWSGRSMVFLCL
jgi:DNA-binding transcriptional ArsR family regulator